MFKKFHSVSNSIQNVVIDILSELKGSVPELIVYFASPKHDLAALGRELKLSLPNVEFIGCSTSGELSSGKMTDGAVSGLAFLKGSLEDFKIEVIRNIATKASEGVETAFSSFEKHFDKSMRDLDPAKHVGILLIDGLSGAEEETNEKIGDLTNLTFIGGSAGDDLEFKQTFVFANGEIFNNAAALVILKPKGQFDILKTQSFRPTDKILKATKIDEKQRQIIELNNRPATVAYSEALNIKVEDLPSFLFKNPLGLMFGDEPFVRSPRVVEGSTIKFYCSVKEGMDLCLLNSTNIIEDTRRDIEKKKIDLKGISAVLNFNCILRTLDLKQQEKTQQYADIFNIIPMAGFSTYGESYIGHINQTATMLILK